MTIAFDSIPSNIRKPGVYMEFNTRLAGAGLPSGDRTMLVIGQKTAAGTKAVELPQRVYSEPEAIKYFGAGSVAHLMVKAAYAANPYANITVIAPADGAESAAAVGTITFTGPATSAGLLTVMIGKTVVEIAIASGASADAIAAALLAVLLNDASLPVVPTANAGVLTLTAKNKGTLGNGITVSAETEVPGVTAVAAPMAGGLVDPDIANCLTAVTAGRFHRVVSSLNSKAALDKLSAHLDFVSGPLEQRPGMGVFGFIGTIEAGKALALNYCTTGRMHGSFLKKTVHLAYEQAAADAAEDISSSDPARPRDGKVIPGLAAPKLEDSLSRTEQEDLLASGLSPLEVNAAGKVTMVRSITTYTTNAGGTKDTALLDTSRIDSLDYMREAWVSAVKTAFPQAKLGMRTPKSVEDILYATAKAAEAPGVEIVQNVDEHKASFLVELAPGKPGWLAAQCPAEIVDGLHGLMGSILLLVP